MNTEEKIDYDNCVRLWGYMKESESVDRGYDKKAADNDRDNYYKAIKEYKVKWGKDFIR